MHSPIVIVPACTRDIGPHPYHAAQYKYVDAVVKGTACAPLILPALGSALDLDLVLDVADGIMLTGSASNVDPAYYAQQVRDPALPQDPARDATTLPLIRAALERGIPIFAICRGFQEMNVAFGGTLHQQLDGPGAERGIVFQEHRLFPWLTVEQNVELGLDASDLSADGRRQRIDSNIELVGLTGFARAHPHQLSGGMAQRAAIARALVGRPEILLLDEPLGALDSLTRSYLQEELLRIWQHQSVTMIMVTHDVEEAVYLSDRVVVMEPRPGRIRSVVPIDLPRARDRAAPEFVALKARVLRDLRH